MLMRRLWPSRPTFDSPFSDFEGMRRQMQRWFDAMEGFSPGEPGSGVFPPLNVTQDSDNLYVRAEIPGVDCSNLEISAEGRRLSISGKREISAESDRVSYHRKERPEGSFNRTLTLPYEFDTSRVEARCTTGVLTVTLPKHEAAKPHQIAVKS